MAVNAIIMYVRVYVYVDPLAEFLYNFRPA